MIVVRLAIRAGAWLFWSPMILAALVRLGWLKCRVIYWRTRLARQRRRRWRMALTAVATTD